ncbi:MAG: DUF5127 domain-containing protein, partial [Terriglobia bacterium]
MRLRTWIFGILLCVIPVAVAPRASAGPFRPPAVPLVAVDPYFSIWSFASHLTYDSTRHWSGMPMVMKSIVRIDGKAYRIMGRSPSTTTPARQLGLRVLPTRTIYEFRAAGVLIRLTFTTPDLPADLDIMARPVTYVTWGVQTVDGKRHTVSIFYDVNASVVVATPDQTVVWSRPKIAGLSVLRMGTEKQPVLARAGDRLKIDWGYLYVAAAAGNGVHAAAADDRTLFNSFITQGKLPNADSTRMPRAAEDGWPALGFTFDLGAVGAQPVLRHLTLAYDEVFPVEYFHVRLRPYWESHGARINSLLQNASRDYDRLSAACQTFDNKLMTSLGQVGGEQYALLASLAYRQAFAANKLALGPRGHPLMFLKEISSCGCAQTADVIYPESPILLFLNPKLLEDSLIPLLDYADSREWPYPYAPHDLGTYPLDNARPPSRMESMPVEESGNMLLMVAAI